MAYINFLFVGCKQVSVNQKFYKFFVTFAKLYQDYIIVKLL